MFVAGICRVVGVREDLFGDVFAVFDWNTPLNAPIELRLEQIIEKWRR